MTTLIGVNVTTVQSKPTGASGPADGRAFSPLNRHTDSLGNVLVYVVASVSIASAACVIINKAGVATQISETNCRKPGIVAVAQANLDDGQYGWCMVQGKTYVQVAASCQPNVPLFTTATSGVLDDATASTSQFQVIGLMASQSQTNATGTVLAYINNPNIQRGNPGATP